MGQLDLSWSHCQRARNGRTYASLASARRMQALLRLVCEESLVRLGGLM